MVIQLLISLISIRMIRARDIGHAESPEELRTIYRTTRKWRNDLEVINGRGVAPTAILKEGEFPQTLCLVSIVLCVTHTKILKFFYGI